MAVIAFSEKTEHQMPPPPGCARDGVTLGKTGTVHQGLTEFEHMQGSIRMTIATADVYCIIFASAADSAN